MIRHSISLVPVEEIVNIWPDIREYIKSAVIRSNGRWTTDKVLEQLLLGKQQLWIAFDKDSNINGTAVTEICQYPNQTVLSVQFLGGKRMNTWIKDMLKVCDDWAKTNECDLIEAVTRYGFWKWLKKDGWDNMNTVFEKRIN